jgi:hypothetical protein
MEAGEEAPIASEHDAALSEQQETLGDGVPEAEPGADVFSPPPKRPRRSGAVTPVYVDAAWVDEEEVDDLDNMEDESSDDGSESANSLVLDLFHADNVMAADLGTVFPAKLIVKMISTSQRKNVTH